MKVLKLIGSIPTDASWKDAEGSSISGLVSTIKTGVAIATVKTGKLKIFVKDEAGKLKSCCKELFTPEHVAEAKHWLMNNFSGVSITDVELLSVEESPVESAQHKEVVGKFFSTQL